MVDLLSADEILGIHQDVLDNYGGGGAGVMDIGGIESAVGRMSSGAGDVELFPDVFDKAGALLEALISHHGFVDGNKRTAVHAAGTLLDQNGWQLSFSPDEVVAFAVGVATHEVEFDEIVAWLREHSTRDE